MPMIDVYALEGTFADKHQLAVDLARTLMEIEKVPNIPMFRQNTAAFIHEVSADTFANVDGDSAHVRVQVLTNASALDREKQLAVVSQFTQIIATSAGDTSLTNGRGCYLPKRLKVGGDSPDTRTPTPSSLRLLGLKSQLCRGGPDVAERLTS